MSQSACRRALSEGVLADFCATSRRYGPCISGEDMNGVIARIGMLVLLASCSSGQLHGGAGGGPAGTFGTGQGASGGTGGGPGGTGGGPGGSGGGPGGTGGGSACLAGGFLALSGAPGGCQPVAPVCGAALCGNGVRDSCAVTAVPGCAARTDIEECDGADFGGATCESRGYASGTPACSQSCTRNEAACNECLPPGDGLLSCGRGPAGFRTFGIAAGDSEVGLAWAHDEATGPVLSFARLSPDLQVISSTIIEQETSGPCQSRWRQIAVAPTASGWLVAVGGEPEVFVIALDLAGQPVGRTVLDRLELYAYATLDSIPLLVPRPDGGPLVFWLANGRARRAAVVSADGRSATAPVDLPMNGTASVLPMGAAYLQGAFHVVAPRGEVDPHRGVKMVRITPQGTIASAIDLLSDESLFIAGVAAGANDIRLLYTSWNTEDDAFFFRRISPTGELLTPAVRLGGARDGRFTNPLAVGNDTVVLSSPVGELGWARLTSDGTIGSRGLLAKAPHVYGMLYLTESGSQLLAAWPQYLARFTP